MFKKLDKNQEKKIYLSILELERQNRDIFYFMKDCSIKVSDKIKTACATFDTTEKKFCIVINENWLNEFNVFNLAALLEHELHHIILSHLFTIKDDHRLSNIAQDAIINDLCHSFKDKKKLNESLSRGVFLENISRDLKEKRILSDYEYLNLREHDSNKIYEFLKLLPDKKTDNYNLIDQHEKIEQDLKDSGLEQIENSSTAQNILSEIFSGENKQAQDSLKNIGSHSEQFKIFFSEIDKKKRIANFKNSILKSLTSNRDIKSKNSIKRPSRRFSSPIGKQKIKKTKIKFCLDLSGSMMDDEILTKMRIAFNTAINLGYCIDLIGGDTKKTLDIKNVKANYDFSDINGGGGTILDFFFTDHKKDNCSYVILTDGHFNLRDIPLEIKSNKLLFLSTDKSKIGNFNTIKI